LLFSLDLGDIYIYAYFPSIICGLWKNIFSLFLSKIFDDTCPRLSDIINTTLLQ
ncbi:hypothetical protein ACJX0J_041150, partial [Zea mays]